MYTHVQFMCVWKIYPECVHFLDWVESPSSSNLVFCKMEACGGSEADFTLSIRQDFTWSVTLRHQLVDRSACEFLQHFPVTTVSATDFAKLVCALDRCTVCEGNQDTNFLKMATCRRGLFKDQTGIYISQPNTI